MISTSGMRAAEMYMLKLLRKLRDEPLVEKLNRIDPRKKELKRFSASTIGFVELFCYIR